MIGHLIRSYGRTSPFFWLLVKHGGDVHRTGKLSQTFLHEAASNGHTRVLRFLLHDAKVDINPTNSKGDTPLHTAVLAGKLAAIHILARNGADLDAKDGRGLIPLYAFVQSCQRDGHPFVDRRGRDLPLLPTLLDLRARDEVKRVRDRILCCILP
jgi:hypothetical protein